MRWGKKQSIFYLVRRKTSPDRSDIFGKLRRLDIFGHGKIERRFTWGFLRVCGLERTRIMGPVGETRGGNPSDTRIERRNRGRKAYIPSLGIL